MFLVQCMNDSLSLLVFCLLSLSRFTRFGISENARLVGSSTAMGLSVTKDGLSCFQVL